LLTVTGKAGHVAYPHLAANPIPILLEYLQVVSTIILDEGMEYFQPSHLEVTTIDVDNLATNVIPRQAHARFNIRFNPLHTADSLMELLKEQAAAVMAKHEGFECSWEWEVSGEAFITNNIRLQNIIKEAIVKVRGVVPEFSTSGGTSDARFIKDLCPVVELGLTNETAHQLDERVAITHLKTLTKIYSQILHSFFETPPCPLCHSSL
jgi:succinyl-diaminopimelate desuccinylase